jgi:PKD-like domain
VYAKNICGGLSQVASKNIWVGKPSIPVVNLFVIPDRASGSTSDLYVCPNKEYTIKFFMGPPNAIREGITHYSWQFSCGTLLSTSADTRSILVKTAMAYNPCEEVWVRAHNGCGISDWHRVNVDFASDCGGRLTTNSVRLFSNPSNVHTFVEIDNLPQVNYNQDTENTSAGFAYQIKVYNQVGTLQKELSTDKVRQKIITSDLPVGQYRVIVSNEFETVEKILLVNR